MFCTYCGESNPIVKSELVTGPICKECWEKVSVLLNKYARELDSFYRDVQNLGLWTGFITILGFIKEDDYKLHFNSVKLDKRLSYPNVLCFRALFADKYPLEIEINIVRYNKGYAISLAYRYTDKTVNYYIDKDGKVLSTNKELINHSLSWQSKEFK